MTPKKRKHSFLSRAFEMAEQDGGSSLVFLHECRIANDVSKENGGKFAMLQHVSLSETGVLSY